MIELKQLTKTFEATTALNHISLCVKEGSIVGLVGSNGAGKSTLLRILAGIYAADAGQVLFDGAPVFENSAVKSNLIFISDTPYFSSGATLRSLAHQYKALYPGWQDSSFAQLKSFFPLSESMRIAQMSKGMQRQAALILGLSTNPKYILLDEIFDGLDPVVREVVKKILISFVSDCGASVIIASHNLRELEDVCDNICLLHSGGIIADSDVENLKLNLTKVHLILDDPTLIGAIEQNLQVLKMNQKGKIYELTLRGNRDDILAYLRSLNPVFMELLSLSLEEVFINEMEVNGYEIGEIFGEDR